MSHDSPGPPEDRHFTLNPDRSLSWDWFPGRVPENVDLHPQAYLETTYSFHLFQSTAPQAVTLGRGASVYLGTMFDLGPNARAAIGDFSLVNGARIVCDSAVEIGPYCLVSWNVLLMDTYRVPLHPVERRAELRSIPTRQPRRAAAGDPGRPIRIERNVWIGFDACILPGVTVGEGSIVGARTVVCENVPPWTVVAGNPARPIRRLDPAEPPATMIP